MLSTFSKELNEHLLEWWLLFSSGLFVLGCYRAVCWGIARRGQKDKGEDCPKCHQYRRRIAVLETELATLMEEVIP